MVTFFPKIALKEKKSAPGRGSFTVVELPQVLTSPEKSQLTAVFRVRNTAISLIAILCICPSDRCGNKKTATGQNMGLVLSSNAAATLRPCPPFAVV